MQKIIPLSFGMALANRAAVSRLRLTAEKASRHFCRETDGRHISLTNLAEAELEATEAKSEIPTVTSEAGVWNAFRLGRWVPPKPATANPNMQMLLDGETINQFMRMQTPDTGALPPTEAYGWKLGEAMRDLLKRTGPAVVGTHSYAGQIGWYGAMKSPDLVKAVVAYEPGQVVYPEGEKVKEMNSEIPLVQQRLNPVRVSKQEFLKLTKMPIFIIFGDNISTKSSKVFNEEVWRWALFNARQFVNLINKYGGDAKLVLVGGFENETYRRSASRGIPMRCFLT